MVRWYLKLGYWVRFLRKRVWIEERGGLGLNFGIFIYRGWGKMWNRVEEVEGMISESVVFWKFWVGIWRRLKGVC